MTVLLSSCSSPHSQTFHAFGTTVIVEIEGVSYKESQDIYNHIDQELQDMHNRWHAWQNSELTDIREACQTGEAIQISDDLVYLIKRGQELETKSLGYFNPAIGELIDLWGFLSHTSTQARTAPTPQAIQAVLSHHPSMHDLHLKGHTLTCTNPHVRLDMGAYAKGYGIEKIMDYLKEQGIKQATLNAGGDLMILQDPSNPAQRIGVLSPDAVLPELVLHINKSTSVFTSGTYARNFRETNSQKQYHHLINPKTGYPSTDFVSVTVVHPDPVLADAAATALLASDKANWHEIVKHMDIEKYLLITADGERISTLDGVL
jgi:thiamine biosynthesis lipoprotein